MSRVLVACYSRTGYTASLAQEIVSMTGWDRLDIKDRHPRDGALGQLRCVLDVLSGRYPDIVADGRPLRDYATVVVAAPVWMERLAAPMRSYIARHKGEFKSLAYVCTYGGRGAENAARQAAGLAGVPLKASLAVTSQELEQADYRRRLDDFLAAVKQT
jgi:flavodoxin